MNYLDEAPKLDDVVEAKGELLFGVSCSCGCLSSDPSFLKPGVKVFIDPKAVMFLLGSRMDFVVSLFSLAAKMLDLCRCAPTNEDAGIMRCLVRRRMQ